MRTLGLEARRGVRHDESAVGAQPVARPGADALDDRCGTGRRPRPPARSRPGPRSAPRRAGAPAPRRRTRRRPRRPLRRTAAGDRPCPDSAGHAADLVADSARSGLRTLRAQPRLLRRHPARRAVARPRRPVRGLVESAIVPDTADLDLDRRAREVERDRERASIPRAPVRERVVADADRLVRADRERGMLPPEVDEPPMQRQDRVRVVALAPRRCAWRGRRRTGARVRPW